MKNYVILICMTIVLLGSVSAFEFDNKISYSENDLRVDFDNAFGLGKHYGSAELKSHSSIDEIKKVGVGNQIVMWYDFNFDEVYTDGLGDVKFIDIKNGEEISKNYEFVYFIEGECSDIMINKSVVEKCGQGTWEKYNSNDIPKNKRIGIKILNTKYGEIIDVVWDIAGKEVSKHAVYQVTDAHGVNLDVITGGDTNSYGHIIRTTFNESGVGTFVSFTTDNDVAANRGRIAFTNGTVISTVAISSNVATFNITVKNNTHYRIEADSDGSSYEHRESAILNSYPQSGTFVKWTDASTNMNTNNSDRWRNIESVFIELDVAIPNDNPTITEIYPTNNTNYNINNIEFSGVFADDKQIANASIYIDGVLNQTNSSVVNGSQTNFTVALSDGQYDWQFKTFDNNSVEVSSAERRLDIDTDSPAVNIIYPENTTYTTDYTTSSTFSLDIESTATDGNLDSCWIDFLNGTNNSITCNSNYTLNSVEYGQHTYRIWANDTFGKTGHDDVTATWDYVILENSDYYNSTSAEMAKERFALNISTNGTAPTDSILEYNGTNYTAGITNIAGNNYNLSATVLVPLSAGNKTWSYYFDIGGDTIQSTVFQQKISETLFGHCNSTITTEFSNYTFFDEGNLSATTASIPSSTWDYYLHNYSSHKSFTYSNITEDNFFSFCGTPTDRKITTNYSLQYEGTNYPQRIFSDTNIFNGTLASNTSLYLLKSSEGIYVTFQVINIAEQALEDVAVNATRLVSGITTLIGIGTTGSDGGVTFWLNPNFQHTFGFSKEGYSTLVSSLFPTQSAYTITLGSTSTTTVTDYTQGIIYTILPNSNEILNNGTLYNFNYTLTSTYNNVEKFGFNLRNSSDTQFNSTSALTNGGFLDINFTIPQTTQDIVMDYYWIINGNVTNGTSTWLVFNSAGTGWGLATFFTDLNSYVTIGLFGLDSFGFAIIGFLVIFLTTGALSYKYGLTSPASITGVILAMTFLMDVGLGLFDGVRYVGAIPYFPTIFVAVVLIGTIIREGVR